MEKTSHDWNVYDYIRTFPAIIFAIVIFYYSSLSAPFPGSPPEPSILELEVNWNDILHLCEFAIFSFLLAFGFFGKVKSRYMVSFAVIFAFLDEIHQYFVPNRYFDWYDVILDVIGVILGFLIYFSLVNIIHKIQKKYSELDFNSNEQ